MELKRIIYEELIKWKEKDTGKVLELEGARQVGKTYIFKKFASEYFKYAIYINMAEPSGKDFLKCLENATSWEIGEVRPEKPLHKAIKLFDKNFQDNKDTIIVIDEIQESVPVFNMIRSLARDFQCYVAAIGSYFGKTLQKDYFLPAGDVDSLVMETLTFVEFLSVFGKNELYNKVSLYGGSYPEEYEELKHYYEIYQKIGGYPEVVATYMEERDVAKSKQKIGSLLKIFINESRRYFYEITDVDIFEKLFNGIAVLMIKEKKV